MGTSTVTTCIESVSGVEAGGRTGFTSVVVEIFLPAIFIPPIALLSLDCHISALIMAGIFIIQILRDLDFET